jgi:PAS domain S-box-containing protein
MSRRPSYSELEKRVQELEAEALLRRKADEVLRRSEERYRMIFNYSPLGIIYFDKDGVITDCNEQFLEIMGASRERLVGFNIIHSLRDERMRDAIVAGISGKPNYFVGEYTSVTGNKATPIRAMFSRINSEDDRFMGAVGLFEDISNQIHAEEVLRESREFLNKIGNSISDPIVVKDRQHRLVLVNDALCALVGRKREEILGKTDYDFFPKEEVDVFREKDELVFETGEENENEESLTDAQGVTRTIVTKKTLINDKDGNKSIVVIMRDITERKQAELSLKAAHEKLQDILEFLPDATLVIDREKKVISWNRAMEDMTGVEKKEIVGQVGFPYAIPFYGERRPILIDLVMEECPTIERKYDFVKRIGSTVYGEAYVPGAFQGQGAYLWSTAAPLYAGDGNIIGFIQSIRDISDRKKAEQELLLSEERFRAIFESARDCIYLKDRSFKYVLVNPAMEKLFGIPTAELIGSNARCLYGEEAGEKVEESDARVFAGEIISRESAKPIRNQNRTFHLIKVPIRDQTNAIVGLCGIARDITERKLTEGRLQDALNFLQVLMDTIPAPIFYKNKDGIYLGCNQAFAYSLGLDREDIIGKSVFEVIPRELAEKHSQMDTTLLENLEDQMYETSLLYADGVMHDVIFSKSTFSDVSGPAGIVGVMLDISKRKRVEQDLRESEKRFRLMAESIQDAFWMGTPDFREIFYINPAYEKIWGRSRQDLYDAPKSFLEYVHPEDKASVAGQIRQLKETGTIFDTQYRIVHPNGAVRWVRNRGFPIRDEHDNVCFVTGVARDITERKMAEDALRQSEMDLRFLSSRLLAAQEEERKRIAGELHDSLGSSLAAIKVGFENIREQAARGEIDGLLLESSISLTRLAIEEVRKIIMDLRPSVLDDLGLVATISWFCGQFGRTHPSIRIDREILVTEEKIPDPLKIVIFRLLQEAFHNLAKHSGADAVKLSLDVKKKMLELRIEDNGEGFDVPSALSRESGNKGLGLTSMKERTEMSGGVFSIESIGGKGTIIYASWPMVPARSTRKATRSDSTKNTKTAMKPCGNLQSRPVR